MYKSTCTGYQKHYCPFFETDKVQAIRSMKRDFFIINTEITVDDLIDWKEQKFVEFASSYGRVNKKLCATLSGGYKVFHNRICILECIQPYQAVELYNSINETTTSPKHT